jgi:hypothetical protein
MLGSRAAQALLRSNSYLASRAPARFLPVETPRLRTLGSIIAGHRRNISGNDTATVLGISADWPGPLIRPARAASRAGKKKKRETGRPAEGRPVERAGSGPVLLDVGPVERAGSGPGAPGRVSNALGEPGVRGTDKPSQDRPVGP